MRRLTLPPQLHRSAGVAHHRTHDVEANPGVGRRRDPAFDGADFHRLRHFAQDGGGQDGKTADAGKDEHARALCLRVELRRAKHEIGGVGEIEIVDAGVDAGGNHPIAIGSIILKGPGGVDNEIGPVLVKGGGYVSAIKRERANSGLPSVSRAKGLGPSAIAAADDKI